MERSADTEGVPRTVRVPPSVGCEHSIGGRHGGEWVGHSKLASVRLQHQSVSIMQSLPTDPHLVGSQTEQWCNIGGRRRATQLNEQPIRHVAECDVPAVHVQTLMLFSDRLDGATLASLHAVGGVGESTNDSTMGITASSSASKPGWPASSTNIAMVRSGRTSMRMIRMC